MRHVTAMTMSMPDILKAPAGTVAYVEVDDEHRAASDVQSQIQGHARYHKVPLATRTVLLVDAGYRTVNKVVRVEVLATE